MTHRRADVDVVRLLALVFMFVAHVAPTWGPGEVLILSDFVTMPLFALLVGVGGQLGEWRAVEGGSRTRWARSMLVRAVLLVVVGLLLMQAGAAVLIVLVFLGVLVVVMDLLASLPSWAVAAFGAAAFLLTPLLTEMMRHRFADMLVSPDVWDPGLWWEVQMFLWGYEPYRLGSMVVYGCVGVLLARWWLRDDPDSVPRWHPLAVGLAALLVPSVVMALRHAGRVQLDPYSGTHAETAFNVSLITAALGLGLWVARVLPRAIISLLGAAGAMSLTIYALHVLWLAFYVRVLDPGASDDSWANLALLTIGSLAVATAWQAGVRRGPWRRGPLEGLAGLLIR